MSKPDRTEPRRVLVTGGAGFIGSHLADHLIDRGDSVVVLDDLSTGRRENLGRLEERTDLRFVRGSVRDGELVETLARDCDRIYHLAAVVGVENVLEDPLAVVEENVLGTRMVLEAARRSGAATFVASTSEVYGKSDDVPFREDSDRVLGPPTTERWSYASSKATDEAFALGYADRHDLPVVIGRFFNTIGRRQVGRYGMVVPTFVDQALRGVPLTVHGSGNQTRAFADVREVVRAVTGLMDDPDAHGRPYNIGSDEEISIMELARRVLERAAPERAGDPDAIRTVPYSEAYGDGYEEFPRRVPDTTRIARQIGWRATRSLTETLDWIIADGSTRRAA